MWRPTRRFGGIAATTAFAWIAAAIDTSHPDPQTIIARSVQANQADWKAREHYDFTETDRSPHGSVTYRVRMIDGSQYYDKTAENGQPLPADEAEREQRKMEEEISRRHSESGDERAKRIAKYRADQERDHTMMSQMAKAFDFAFVRQESMGPRQVWELKATPRASYQPPNMEAQALRGMAGTLWIDTTTYQWVKVQAHVTHPVSIEGFLAEADPGTYFELDCAPVTSSIWLPQHFVMRSRAKVLHLIRRRSQDNETYSDYTPSAALVSTRP